MCYSRGPIWNPFPRLNFRSLPARLLTRGSRSSSPLPVPKSPKLTSIFSPPRSATGTLDRAYARACWQFFDWCAAHGLELTSVRPFHVAAQIEDFSLSKPTIKQKLAAVRMLYDFLVVRQITPSNPAHSVRGSKYVSRKAKRPSGAAKTPKHCWIPFQRIRCPAYGTWLSSPRCSTASPFESGNACPRKGTLFTAFLSHLTIAPL